MIATEELSNPTPRTTKDEETAIYRKCMCVVVVTLVVVAVVGVTEDYAE